MAQQPSAKKEEKIEIVNVKKYEEQQEGDAMNPRESIDSQLIWN